MTEITGITIRNFKLYSMKRVLIISENDATGHRLNLLFQSLYNREKKELYWCSIDIIDCRQESTLYPHKLEISLSNKNLIHSIEPFRSTLAEPSKVLTAKTCNDIVKIIKNNKIDIVIIPGFIYDNHRKRQYETIVKDIKKMTRVEVIGLYI